MEFDQTALIKYRIEKIKEFLEYDKKIAFAYLFSSAAEMKE